MSTLLPITDTLLELLKPQAARYLGVNTSQIGVEYIQDVFPTQREYILDFTHKGCIGYMLGIGLVGNDTPIDSSYGLYFHYPDSCIDSAMLCLGKGQNESSYYNFNLFFDKMFRETLDIEVEFVVSYLKFTRL